jgi:hypothetical protein
MKNYLSQVKEQTLMFSDVLVPCFESINISLQKMRAFRSTSATTWKNYLYLRFLFLVIPFLVIYYGKIYYTYYTLIHSTFAMPWLYLALLCTKRFEQCKIKSCSLKLVFTSGILENESSLKEAPCATSTVVLEPQRCFWIERSWKCQKIGI